MFYLNSISNDPYFNLATEEFLLKETKEEYFLTYINEPSIIVGKHQNTYAEINLDFVRRNNIKVARRLTGGGTVFHDYGNLNYTFIVNGKEGHQVDFKKHTRPIIGFLESLSIKAEFGGKNDLLMNGLKISGNAEHVFRNRVLHHGTLLVDAKLSSLSDALKVNPMKYSDKAVRSIRSKVSNISGSLKEQVNIDQLKNRLTEFIRKEKEGINYILTVQDIERISALRDQKFSVWEWNFGYGPKYIFTNTIKREGRLADICLEVVRGMIIKASVKGDLFSESCALKINNALINSLHHYERILGRLRQISDNTCFQVVGYEEFTQELF